MVNALSTHFNCIETSTNLIITSKLNLLSLYEIIMLHTSKDAMKIDFFFLLLSKNMYTCVKVIMQMLGWADINMTLVEFLTFQSFVNNVNSRNQTHYAFH